MCKILRHEYISETQVLDAKGTENICMLNEKDTKVYFRIFDFDK